MSALLNGQFVDDAEITPAKHKFVGMFRPAENPLMAHGCYFVICPCGDTLKYVHESREHYLKGCLDTPQYVDIDGTSRAPSPKAANPMNCAQCGAEIPPGYAHICSGYPIRG
jgi:hypothetical protein